MNCVYTETGKVNVLKNEEFRRLNNVEKERLFGIIFPWQMFWKLFHKLFHYMC